MENLNYVPPGASTQVRRPWAAIRRTVVAAGPAVVTLIVLMPVIVEASGLAKTSIGAAAIGFCMAVTRVLALPGVDAWLERHVPWLSAKGRAPVR